MLVNVFLVIVVVMCDAGLVHVTTNSAACNIIKSHQPLHVIVNLVYNRATMPTFVTILISMYGDIGFQSTHASNVRIMLDIAITCMYPDYLNVKSGTERETKTLGVKGN